MRPPGCDFDDWILVLSILVLSTVMLGTAVTKGASPAMWAASVVGFFGGIALTVQMLARRVRRGRVAALPRS